MRQDVYFALGARDGDPLTQMQRGLRHLDVRGVSLIQLSSLWETEPVDLPPGGPVLNAAARCRTDLRPEELLRLFQRAEEASGRRRDPDRPWRSLDLDILLAGALRVDGPDLQIPHPRFHARRFNLAPLAEIAGGVRHPVLNLTISDFLAACEDPAWVRRIPGSGDGSWSGLPLRGLQGSGKISSSPGHPAPRAPLSP